MLIWFIHKLLYSMRERPNNNYEKGKTKTGKWEFLTDTLFCWGDWNRIN